MSTASPAAHTYQPELTGLRAVAACLIIISHWTALPFPLDEPGPILFIVLSGYLISGLLWKNDIYWGGDGNWPRRLGVFYLRRLARILPPYYAALLLGALLPLATLHQYPLWFLLPAANLLCYRLQTWPEGVGHYWTTALEEQFYLLWPLLLTIFRCLRISAVGLWATISFAPLFRIAWMWAVAPGFVMVLLPAGLDLFATGALLQLQSPQHRASNDQFSGWLALATWLSWALVWCFTNYVATAHNCWPIVSHSLGAGASYCTLRWLLTAPPTAHWLRHPAVQWLGERSYGLYLYHLMLPVFYQRLIYHLLPADAPQAISLRHFWLSPLPSLFIFSSLLLAISAASWRWLEVPFHKLRKRFTYSNVTALQL
jgi:peptidoglycan/LPS O-acetylase OafA/YrhL